MCLLLYVWQTVSDLGLYCLQRPVCCNTLEDEIIQKTILTILHKKYTHFLPNMGSSTWYRFMTVTYF